MSKEQRRGLIESWARAWSTQDSELMLSLFVDDCMYEDVAEGSIYRGKRQIADLVARGVVTLPDVKMTPRRIIVDGDAGATEYRMTGTHLGDWPGLPATGNAIDVRIVAFFEFEDGGIKRISEYWDLRSSGFMGATA